MRKILMIPGPTEYETEVLETLAMPTIAHTSKEFLAIFKATFEKVLKIFDADNAFPFILSGSGTLAMEIGTINFIKRDSKVLVVNNGFFGDRFVDLLSRFTKNVDVYKPELGYPADPKEIYERAKSNEYDLITVTHVDTSTGVKNNIKEIAKYFKDLDTILAVDGVCSMGGEEFHLDWGVDVAFTASQKAIGAPPGLALGVVGQKALKILDKNPPLSFFSDLRKWQMVFKNILELKPGYFGTPNVNLITALNMSLMSILNEGLERRIERHRIIGESFRTAIDALGLEMIPKCAYANTLSVQYLPKNVKQSSFLAEADRYGAVFAGGLVPEIKDKYFRIGHMGSVTSSEVMISLSAIERALKKNGFDVKLGIGLTAAQEVLHKYDLENSS